MADSTKDCGGLFHYLYYTYTLNSFGQPMAGWQKSGADKDLAEIQRGLVECHFITQQL